MRTMRRWVSGVLLVSVFGLMPVHAVDEAPSLAGTVWAGTDSDGDAYVFTFEADGTLAYRSPSGSYRNGRWSQFRSAVQFDTNDHYSDYLGEIRGKTMQGKAWNTKGLKWTWKATRQ